MKHIILTISIAVISLLHNNSVAQDSQYSLLDVQKATLDKEPLKALYYINEMKISLDDFNPELCYYYLLNKYRFVNFEKRTIEPEFEYDYNYFKEYVTKSTQKNTKYEELIEKIDVHYQGHLKYKEWSSEPYYLAYFQTNHVLEAKKADSLLELSINQAKNPYAMYVKSSNMEYSKEKYDLIVKSYQEGYKPALNTILHYHFDDYFNYSKKEGEKFLNDYIQIRPEANAYFAYLYLGYNVKKAWDLAMYCDSIGHPYSHRMKGECYYAGGGVPKDYFKAKEHYLKGIEAGDYKCYSIMANLYTRGYYKFKRNFEEFYKNTKLAEQYRDINTSILLNIGLSNYYGTGTEKNISNAEKYFLSCLDWSLEETQYEYISNIVKTKMLVDVRYDEYIQYNMLNKYFNSMEDKGVAAYYLGLLYFKGIERPVDYTLAKKYFDISVSFMNYDAFEYLHIIYRDGLGVPIDIKKSRTYIRR